MAVAFVIDHSGSMEGEPLARAKAAARGLVERLGPSDYAAVIQYDNVADVLVPAIPVDVEGKQRLLSAIDSVWHRGGTNIGAGLQLGRDEIKKNLGGGRVNRVILLSDGMANAGIREVPEFARLASDAAEHGVRISAVGLGDNYNEDLMQAMGEHWWLYVWIAWMAFNLAILMIYPTFIAPLIIRTNDVIDGGEFLENFVRTFA